MNLDLKPTFTEDHMALTKFSNLFAELIFAYPKISPQAHMRAIIRSKGETIDNPNKGDVDCVDPYKWDIKRLLKKTESYYKEMALSGYVADTDEYVENEFEYKKTK